MPAAAVDTVAANRRSDRALAAVDRSLESFAFTKWVPKRLSEALERTPLQRRKSLVRTAIGMPGASLLPVKSEPQLADALPDVVPGDALSTTDVVLVGAIGSALYVLRMLPNAVTNALVTQFLDAQSEVRVAQGNLVVAARDYAPELGDSELAEEANDFAEHVAMHFKEISEVVASQHLDPPGPDGMSLD